MVRNSVVHSPSSVVRDPRYGNVFICANCSFWMSMRRALPSLAITLVLSILMSRLQCICGWLGLDDPPTPVVLPLFCACCAFAAVWHDLVTVSLGVAVIKMYAREIATAAEITLLLLYLSYVWLCYDSIDPAQMVLHAVYSQNLIHRKTATTYWLSKMLSRV